VEKPPRLRPRACSAPFRPPPRAGGRGRRSHPRTESSRPGFPQHPRPPAARRGSSPRPLAAASAETGGTLSSSFRTARGNPVRARRSAAATGARCGSADGPRSDGPPAAWPTAATAPGASTGHPSVRVVACRHGTTPMPHLQTRPSRLPYDPIPLPRVGPGRSRRLVGHAPMHGSAGSCSLWFTKGALQARPPLVDGMVGTYGGYGHEGTKG
jgi:hypothetical protein